jgi:hypothetical protein
MPVNTTYMLPDIGYSVLAGKMYMHVSEIRTVFTARYPYLVWGVMGVNTCLVM